MSLAIARYRGRRYFGWLREIAPQDWEQCVTIGAIDLTEMGTVLDGLPEQAPEGEYSPDEVREMVEEQL